MIDEIFDRCFFRNAYLSKNEKSGEKAALRAENRNLRNLDAKLRFALLASLP